MMQGMHEKHSGDDHAAHNKKEDVGIKEFLKSQESDTKQQEDPTVFCPIMGTEMKASKAFDKTEYNGKTYYFCCAGCKPEFLKNPEKYIK